MEKREEEEEEEEVVNFVITRQKNKHSGSRESHGGFEVRERVFGWFSGPYATFGFGPTIVSHRVETVS